MDNRALGVVLLVVGGGLLWWGYDVAQSVRGQWIRAWSGSLPDKAMLLYLGGAVCAALGAFLLVRRK
jgi:hypothetical protein